METLTPYRPRHDPPVRRDKKCYICKGVRAMPPDPKGIYKVERDPFCSTQCCKSFYDVAWEIKL